MGPPAQILQQTPRARAVVGIEAPAHLEKRGAKLAQTARMASTQQALRSLSGTTSVVVEEQVCEIVIVLVGAAVTHRDALPPQQVALEPGEAHAGAHPTKSRQIGTQLPHGPVAGDIPGFAKVVGAQLPTAGDRDHALPLGVQIAEEIKHHREPVD